LQPSIYNRALFSAKNRLFAQPIKPIGLLILALMMGFIYVLYLTLEDRQTQQLVYQQHIEPYKQLLLVDSVSVATQSNEAPSQLIEVVDEADNLLPTKDSKALENSYVKPPIAPNTTLSACVSHPITSSPKVIAEKGSDQHSFVLQLEKRQQTADLLMIAYQAWQSGDLVQAETIYQALLAKQPKLKDALWGMLAVSQLNGSDLSIVRSYATQLRLVAPYDDAVRLETDRILMPANQPDWHESTLKMAQSAPVDVAQISYRLGVYYAEQKRWSEAQSAFFDAVKIAPEQVNYRINLGVSYDQLGKYQLAMQHYQQALSIAHPSAIYQELAAIRDRLTFLQTHHEMEN
jgi:tetratricopeptide (TPR) repeat protein